MYRGFFKRAIDIALCIIGLPVFALIFIVIAPIIYLEDKGPVFYKSNRVGKDCKIFGMLKFRSMKVNAPDIYNEDGSTFNSEDDPRQTKIGKFIRKTSLDEVPQILNVLKGDMSIIGPRPCLEEQLDTYSEAEKEKMSVKPGITGYTQAYYRNELESHEERLKDIWYVRNISFTMDLKIVFKTASIILTHKNVYKNESYNEQVAATEEQENVIEN